MGLVLFDVLMMGDRLLTSEPLSERRALLEQLLPHRHRSRELDLAEQSDDQALMLKRAQAFGWEGLVAKHLDSQYIPGARSQAWIKHKLTKVEPFTICGFRKAGKGKSSIGSLIVAEESSEGLLSYACELGTGFSDKQRREIFQLLSLIVTDTSPLTGDGAKDPSVTWVRPMFRADVKYLEKTKARRLRHASFTGIHPHPFHKI
ncbi:MAG: hypothetical protein EOP06_09655 [Proteobacteria bacterium]|nr:MAG: hypothetical protein EOP06_09655 [Pseudomonadota bacterium]